MWDLRTGRELLTLTGHRNWVNAAAVTPDGQRVVSASSDEKVKVWDLGSGRELLTLAGDTSRVTALAVTPDGKQALVVWDLDTGQKLRVLSGHRDPVKAVEVSPNGQQVISASDDWTLKVWDLETAEVLATFTCDSAALCCAFADRGKLIVAGDDGGHVHFLRFEEPKPKP